MAHPVQWLWCEKIKKDHPSYFQNKRVLDIGSLDINGNNRYLFEGGDYIGLDLVPGPNVDVVSIAHMYKPSALFDVIISTNALEHDLYWRQTLCAMLTFLKPVGLMFFSVASSWPEHGTKRAVPEHSGTSQMGPEWENYYQNLHEMDIAEGLDLNKFYRYQISTFANDLRFWGIKKANCT
jgi:hypothetical protein